MRWARDVLSRACDFRAKLRHLSFPTRTRHHCEALVARKSLRCFLVLVNVPELVLAQPLPLGELRRRLERADERLVRAQVPDRGVKAGESISEEVRVDGRQGVRS